MTFAIVAEFPLGMYQGHRPDGSVDPLPSPARLHAALLAAAGQGARADLVGEMLVPAAADRNALTWLETHPPDALSAPATLVDDRGAAAHRQEGFFGSRRDRGRILETRLDQRSGVAIGGPIGWIWDDPPPADIAASIEALCRDVPHLGTADSPVVLAIGTLCVTHRLDPQARLASLGGVELDVPRPGRTAALERAFIASVGRPPTTKHDLVKQVETAITHPVERASLVRARYTPIAPPSPTAPWSMVVLLPIDRPLAPESRVAWAVALHRALVARIGAGAPALVTGKYEPDVVRPANRLAIQYLPASISAAPPLETPGAITLLVPADAAMEDLAVLDRALRGLDEIGLGGGRTIRLRHAPTVLPGDSFWAPVTVGHVRTWVTATPAIPESRPVRGRSWTVGDAALLSVGLALRDRFPRPSRRQDWYGDLVDAVSASGAMVLEAHKLNDGDIRRWVHRVGAEAAIQPYRVALRLGDLLGEQTLIAIGQSRHLGGGLLVPVDLPVDDPS